MDDFSISTLHDSRNEWCSRLLTILTPLIVEGLKSIFEESFKLCKENNEMDKYLMTFQNFISRIPKWNSNIIEQERKRIIDKSGCGYLDDLITCVHIIQLKTLSAMRAGQKQKKIDILIPKMDDFIHKTYIHVARKVYKNVYLFELQIPPLQVQKNNRELETIVQECILNSIRESIPVESILRAYMDETTEEDFIEEVKEQIIETSEQKDEREMAQQVDALIKENKDIISTEQMMPNIVSFNNIDMAQLPDKSFETINAPKDFETLEQLSEQRRLETNNANNYDGDDDDDKIKIFGDVSLSNLDVHSMDLKPEEEDSLPALVFDEL